MWNREATVLLVEDDVTVRKTLKRVIDRMGCTVFEAGNGQEALDLAREHLTEMDILLIDLILPGKISGYQLAIQLQSRKPALRLVFTSGYDPIHFEKELLLVEGKNFLGKPYSAQHLQNLFASLYEARSEKLTTPV